MDAAQLTRELNIVRRLCFITQVDYVRKNKTIIVRLAPPVIQYLPQDRWSIKFQQDEFTATNVLKAYKTLVVDHLSNALALAEQLLEDSTMLEA